MRMSDRQRLHAAALEAGFASIGGCNSLLMTKTVNGAVMPAPWNPLEDTEEALELAAKLKMSITFADGAVLVQRGDHQCVQDLSKGLPAVRRAIVTIAAGVGDLPK